MTTSAGGGWLLQGRSSEAARQEACSWPPIQLFSKQTASGTTLEPQCGPYPPRIEYMAMIYDKGQGVSNPDPG